MTTPYRIYRRPDSGNFRHRLDVLKPPTELDGRGQPVGEWKPCHGGLLGKIEPITGRQIETARALYNEATVRISFRFVAGIHPKQRIRFAPTGQLYHIGYVDNVQYERSITVCLCSEVV